MTIRRLVLYPKDPLLQLPLQPLRDQLQQQQMMDEALPNSYGAESYQVGARFFDAFLFLGCSPSIELAPTETGAPFCYLQLESETQCRLVSGSNLKSACKACKQRYGVLPELVDEVVPVVHCDHCGATIHADQIAWRKTAALSATRISLWNIFEGEAVPSDQLLGLLQRESGVDWSYAYIGAP